MMMNLLCLSHLNVVSQASLLLLLPLNRHLQKIVTTNLTRYMKTITVTSSHPKHHLLLMSTLLHQCCLLHFQPILHQKRATDRAKNRTVLKLIQVLTNDGSFNEQVSVLSSFLQHPNVHVAKLYHSMAKAVIITSSGQMND